MFRCVVDRVAPLVGRGCRHEIVVPAGGVVELAEPEGEVTALHPAADRGKQQIADVGDVGGADLRPAQGQLGAA